MKITSITLNNFRNFENITVRPNTGINYIYGLNGKGKTNFVESISYLSLGKSYKGISDKIITKNGCDYFYIKTILDNKNTLEIGVSEKKKVRKYNSIEIKRAIEFVGYLKSVVFSSKDLSVINGIPQDRRRFLDIFLSQTDKYYLNALNNYKHLNEQKNIALKQGNVDKRYVLSLNEQIKPCIQIIEEKRIEFINYLNENIQVIYEYLTRENANIEIKYKTCNLGELDGKLEAEIQTGFSLLGSHRTNYNIYLNSLNCENYASQGQQRLLILAIKILQVLFVQEKTKDLPILILDDVFSELDKEKSKYLMEYIKSIGCQTFITTTEKTFEDNDFLYLFIDNDQIN